MSQVLNNFCQPLLDTGLRRYGLTIMLPRLSVCSLHPVLDLCFGCMQTLKSMIKYNENLT